MNQQPKVLSDRHGRARGRGIQMPGKNHIPCLPTGGQILNKSK